MKYVSTARGYQRLVVAEDVTLSSVPQKVSVADADAYAKTAKAAGVELVIVDESDEAAAAAAAAPASVTGRTPDLSAGVSFVSGSGDPVQTPGATPEGTTPEQAGAQEGAGTTTTAAGGKNRSN